MEALVPAFIAAALAQLGERSPWLAAILADRFGRPLVVAMAMVAAQAGGIAVAAIGGALVAPFLAPEARLLLVGLALAFAGLGSLLPMRVPDRLEGWRLGSVMTPLIGGFILAAGDATQFLAFTLSARGEAPLFAGIGAAMGAGLVNAAAAVMGELEWRALPLRWLRIGSGLLFLAAAALCAVGAFGLI